MKKIKFKYIVILLIAVFVFLFGYSYVGIDKETGVPKGLLMKIRPLPWEEIYWDESDQLLKLTVKDETLDGKESRCLRNFKLTPSGLLMGGREFNSLEATSRLNARLDYTVENQVLTIIDKKYSKEIFCMNLEVILDEGDSITEVTAGPVFYELGEEIVLTATLEYKTEKEPTILHQEPFFEVKAIVSYTEDYMGCGEDYEIEQLHWRNIETSNEVKEPVIHVQKSAEDRYYIEIFDEEDVAKPPIQMMIPIKLDEAGNILKEQSSNFETGTLVNYDSVNIYFDDQSKNIKYVWITINGVNLFSESGQFMRRMDFEYELMFKFDTESLEVFDVQKSEDAQVEL